jgi:long-chain acyl-CoA synthetase
MFPDKRDVFVCKRGGEWKTYSSQDYINLSTWFSYGLMECGLQKGQTIASISSNLPEWNFMDVGMAQIGVIHVPIFPTIHQAEFEHILRHSGARMLFISDRQLYAKFEPVARKIMPLRSIFTLLETAGALHWMEIVESGKINAGKHSEQFEINRNSILPTDAATLLYTSGTTGESKGVMLSHKNLVSNFVAASEVFHLEPSFRYLSILPLCHVGGRLGNYQTQYSGTSIYYAENMAAIAANMKEIRPEGFDAVPRILEKILSTIIARGQKLTGLKKWIFFWSIRLGMKYDERTRNALGYRLKHAIADKLVFKKWREAIGGRIRIVGCGGAALQPQVERIFWAAGVIIINMYGLTETSPIITINRQNHPDVMLGSVGCAIRDVEIKIAGDGEILCKGPNVMASYFKDEPATKAAFDQDGWFRTGDIGFIRDNKFLVVTDRKKEMFKLANGKFIAPQMMENKLRESIYIDQAFIVGAGQKHIGAIISPNFDTLKDQLSILNIEMQPIEEMIGNPVIIKFYQEIVDKLNTNLLDYQRIKKVLLVSDAWTPASGELSHTLKLKRRYLYDKYEHLISHLYSQIL